MLVKKFPEIQDRLEDMTQHELHAAWGASRLSALQDLERCHKSGFLKGIKECHEETSKGLFDLCRNVEYFAYSIVGKEVVRASRGLPPRFRELIPRFQGFEVLREPSLWVCYQNSKSGFAHW